MSFNFCWPQEGDIFLSVCVICTSVIGETQLAGARRATVISLLSAACVAVRFFLPRRRFPSINDAAGVEAVLRRVQDDLLVDVEEREPGRDPLQQLHGKEQRRRSVRTVHFLQHPAQQWRWKAGRFVVPSCAEY